MITAQEMGSQGLIDDILTLAQQVPALGGADLEAAAATAAALEAWLRRDSEYCLALPVTPDTPDADTTDAGTQLMLASIEVGLAAKALATAAQWSRAPREASVAAEVIAINLRMARSRLLQSLRPLAKVSPSGAWPVVSAANAAATPQPQPSKESGAAEMDLGVLRNIASFHREHERFYTLNITEVTSDLYREANKLRILAGVWSKENAETPATGIDFSLPQYQAAGCVDLNALSAIAAIGVLFMEGEAEPSEIRAMKGKLQSVAASWSHVGQWLASKMDAAWEREQVAFVPKLIGVAQARFNTIATNWCGAREMHFAGLLLTRAVAQLQAMNFSPAAIRADRAAVGQRLLATAWTISLAGQVMARSAADLAENDRCWTHYLDGLPN